MRSFDAIQATAFASLNDELEQAVAELIEEIRAELREQGHNLTGALSRSITQKVTEKAASIISEVSMLRYGAIQNDGVKPSRIPFGRPSSAPGGKSQFITALQEWVKRRGIESNDKLALGIAFAIAKKMKKEGMPTRGAQKFSRNGRRKGFFDISLTRATTRLTGNMEKATQNYVENLIDGSLSDISAEYENFIYS